MAEGNLTRARRTLAATALAMVGFVLSAAVPCPAGEPSKDPRPTESVERVDVRVVRISVIAEGREGRTVTDLRPEDLEVSLEGRELKVAGVRPDLSADAGDLPEVSLRIDVGDDSAVRRTASRRPRYWLLFIDTDNDVPGNLPKVAEAVGGFIEKSIDPSDFVGVVSYNGRLHVEQLFTTVQGDAVSAVEQAYARPRTSGVNTAQRMRAAVRRMDDCRFIPTPGDPTPEAEEGYSITPDTEALYVPCAIHLAGTYVDEMRFRSDRYFGALELGVRLASGMPRGPTVLAISHGISVHPKREFMDALRASFGEGQVAAVANKLVDDDAAAVALLRVEQITNREGVRLYFVDPTKKTGKVRSARQQRLYLSEADPVSTAWAAAQTDLGNLAEATGGRFAADLDIVPSLEMFVAREDHRLIVDVYVPADLDDDAISAIDVRSAADGVRVAASRTELEPRVPRELRVAGAAQLGAIKPRPEGPAGGTQIFLLGVRQKDMDYEREGDNMVADLSLHVRVETVDGRHLVDSPHVFRHTYPLDKWEAAGDATLAVRGYLEAPPGDYRIIAAFRNTRTRKTGTIVEEVHIP
jgi:VWFA-related protein